MARERSTPDPEFNKYRLDLERRLRREGRWAEARVDREKIRKRLRAGGATADEAVRHAWAEMERMYPPLREEEVAAKKIAAAEERAKKKASEMPEPPGPPEPPKPEPKPEPKPDKPPAEKSYEGPLLLPPAWGELPAEAKWEDEVNWVYSNLALCRETHKAGAKMNLNRALSHAPSIGAVTLMQFAVSNPTKFMSDLLPKAKREAEGESEMVQRERKSIAEIDQILQQTIATMETNPDDVVRNLLDVLKSIPAALTGDDKERIESAIARAEEYLGGSST